VEWEDRSEARGERVRTRIVALAAEEKNRQWL